MFPKWRKSKKDRNIKNLPRVHYVRRQQHFGQHFDPPLVQPVALVHLVRLVELGQLVMGLLRISDFKKQDLFCL